MTFSRNASIILLVSIFGSGCATPSKETEFDNRTNAVTRMCGGGASYLNTATFKVELDKLIKQGVGSGALATNSELKTALMSHPSVTDANIENIYSTFTKCVTTNNLLPSGNGTNAVVVVGDGSTTGNITATAE